MTQGHITADLNIRDCDIFKNKDVGKIYEKKTQF
jgi:hypothetical protein